MEFTFWSVMGGFFFGVFGVYLIKEGRKHINYWHLALGLGLLVFPYFVSNTLLVWVIGMAGLTLAYVKR